MRNCSCIGGRNANREEECFSLVIGVVDLKAGVIDVGTNTVKAVIGERDPQGNIYILKDSAKASRLGENVDAGGALQPQAQQRTISAIADFVKLAHSFGADDIRVVATSAMRDARNSQEFVDLVKCKIGIDMEILSEEDEGRFSYSSVALDPEMGGYKGTLAVVDIGGGSTEVTLGDANQISFTKSIRIGAVRLTERVLHSDPPSPDELAEAGTIAREAIRDAVCGREASRIAQVGGSGVNVARVFKQVPPNMTHEVHGAILMPDDVRRILEHLSGLTVEQKKQVIGIEPDRADIILAGAIILDSVISTLKASEIVVSTKGLRHGVLYQMLG